MIINGGSRSSGRFFARHLTNESKNGRVELCEIRGLLASSVPGAFREMEAIATGTRVKNYFYHANVNPRDDERLTPEQWGEAVDLLEKNLGLEGQPRFVIEHEKEGRIHRHIVWSRVDADTMKAISDSLTARIHEQTSRALEEAFGLAPTESVLIKDRERERERAPEGWAMFRAQDTGLDPRAITAEVTGLWQGADSGKAFAAALAERGYILAKGDRRDFVILDQAGDEHSLARRIKGVKAAEVRSRMGDVDRDSLPSVSDAREQYRADRGNGEFLEGRAGDISREPEAEPDGAPAGRAIDGDEPELAMSPEMEEAQFDADVAPFIDDMRKHGEVRDIDHGALTWWQIGALYVERGMEALERFVEGVRDRAIDFWQHFTRGGREDPERGRDSGPDLG